MLTFRREMGNSELGWLDSGASPCGDLFEGETSPGGDKSSSLPGHVSLILVKFQRDEM